MKIVKIILLIVLALCSISCKTTIEQDKKVIGLAWKPGFGSDEMNKVVSFLQQADADVIMLKKTTSSDLAYYEDGSLSDDNLNFDFSLNDDAVSIIKETKSLEVDEKIEEIDLLIFLGGEDISQSLYFSDYELMDEPIYNPERDASDYLLMRYALERDIPILGICRGMQMLYVVNGGKLITDLPTYFNENGNDDLYVHRTEDEKKTYHTIDIKDKKLKSIIKSGYVSSSHHQAVDFILPENIEVLAYTGPIIEAIKMKDKDNVLGVQFHPEYYNSEVMKEEGIKLIKSLIK